MGNDTQSNAVPAWHLCVPRTLYDAHTSARITAIMFTILAKSGGPKCIPIIGRIAKHHHYAIEKLRQVEDEFVTASDGEVRFGKWHAPSWHSLVIGISCTAVMIREWSNADLFPSEPDRARSVWSPADDDVVSEDAKRLWKWLESAASEPIRLFLDHRLPGSFICEWEIPEGFGWFRDVYPKLVLEVCRAADRRLVTHRSLPGDEIPLTLAELSGVKVNCQQLARAITRRPAYGRDHHWRKWQMEGLGPVKIIERWNALSVMERTEICPRTPQRIEFSKGDAELRKAARNLVKTAIRRAAKEARAGIVTVPALPGPIPD